MRVLNRRMISNLSFLKIFAARVENALEGDKNRIRDQLGDFGSNLDKR